MRQYLRSKFLYPAAVAAALLLWTSAASAVSVSFAGNYLLEDPGNNGFSESLTFDNPLGSGSGIVGSFDPTSDALFSDAGFEWVVIADLTLDPSNPFFFDPTLYAGGFEIHDDDGTLLFSADLVVDELVIIGGTGSVNSELDINLTNLVAGGSYVPGSSEIIDAFLDADEGIANLTLQFPGSNLAAQILAGNSVNSTYSGAATPPIAVPEPPAWLLAALGSLGLAIKGRPKRAKAVD